MSSEITKFMCIVETKNYPVNTISPNIQRYSRIKKKFNASEIANCLTYYATVTLVKNNGSQVRLTKDNYKTILVNYQRELEDSETAKAMFKAEKNNTEALQEMKEEAQTTSEDEADDDTEVATTAAVETQIEVSATESLEVIQEDPEDPDTSDFSYIDGEDD